MATTITCKSKCHFLKQENHVFEMFVLISFEQMFDRSKLFIKGLVR